MKTQFKDEKGFSLVELMISLVMSAIIAYAIFAILRTSNEQTQSADVKMAIQDSAREGLYKMLQELRLSSPDQTTVSTNSIQFKIPNPDAPLGSDYKVDWTNAHSITYSLGGTNNKQIIRTNKTTGQMQVVANDVASLSFTGDATPPRVVTVTMTVQRAMVNSRQMTATPLQLIGKAELKNP